MYIQLKIDDITNQVDCAEIEGVSINTTPEVMGIASFVDEAAECAAIPATTLSNYTILDTQEVQSVKDYLARPRLIISGSLTPSAGNFYNYNIKTAIDLRTLLTTVHWDRLRGAVGFRATLKFTLVVAATPFHQGIVNLSWQYATSSLDSTNYTRAVFYPMSVQTPHVRLDVSEQTMVSLDVPYVCHTEYFPIDGNNEISLYYGCVSLTKLTNPRVIVGQSAPEFSLYLSLHDIELVGAVPYTASAVTLQSGRTPIESVPRRGPAPLTGGVSEVTREIRKSGLVGKVLESGANVARYASHIPGLSAVGGTADWFLRSASKVASAFGYSKPNDENKPTRINRIQNAGDTHVDVPFQGYVTGPFQSHKLAVNSAVGCTDEDQMAFDYVLTKPSIIYRGQMAEADTQGSLLYGSLVCPEHFWFRDRELGGTALGNIAMPNTSTLTTNVILPSNLAYVANNFRYWRGNLKFTVTFSKSKMHGGRVQFAFFPYWALPNATSKLGTTVNGPENAGGLVQPSGLTTVFDLRDGASFEYVVPYISLDPYMAVDGTIGSVTMIVIDTLKAPGVASSTVDFIVEVAAEPGFELAVVAPATLNATAVNGTTAIQWQSGSEPIVSVASDASQSVIGEKFNSLKQLAMVPGWFIGDLNNASTVRATATPWYKLNAVPNAIPMGSTVNDTALFLGNPCMRVASMYSFVNGSTIYTYFRDGGPTVNATCSAYTASNTGGALIADVAGLWNKAQNSSAALTVLESAETSRFSVPSYSRYMRLPMTQMVAALGGWQRTLAPGGDGTVPYNPAFMSNRVDLFIRNNSGSTRRFAIGRAAADDARASQFVGAPPCAIYPSTATVSPVASGAVSAGIGAF